jgi:hypothetical protein
VAAQLKELVETKLSQYVPREQDRAGVLTFYKARNFAPIWIASGKPAPRTGTGEGLPQRRGGGRSRSGGLCNARASPIRPNSPPTSWR